MYTPGDYKYTSMYSLSNYKYVYHIYPKVFGQTGQSKQCNPDQILHSVVSDQDLQFATYPLGSEMIFRLWDKYGKECG